MDSSGLTHLTTVLAAAALKATVVLALAILVNRLLRRRSAALRHLVWTAALGSIVTMFVLPAVLPAWRMIPAPAVADKVAVPRVRDLSLLQKQTETPTTNENGLAFSVRPAPRGVSRDRTERASARDTATWFRGVSWPVLIACVWLIGVIALAFRYVSSRAALIRLARSSVPPAESDAVVRQICRQMRITRPVCLRSSDDVELPFTWGVFRPQIVLPADASEWTAECRMRVLQHELAHIRRLDAGTQLVAQAASALFWFHPLVWYAVEKMRSERERACDDYVLASGAVACDYASDLLALVTSHRYVEHHAIALAFARRSHFEGRLLALLDPTIERGVVSRRRAVAVISVSAALVLPLAALERAEARPVPPVSVSMPVVVQQTAPDVAMRPTPALTARAAVGPATRVAAPPPPMSRVAEHSTQSGLDDVFARCAVRTWAHHSEHSSSGDGPTVWTASGRNDGCAFDLKSEGDVVLSADAMAIERIAAGGYVDVTTDIRGDVTHVVARPSANGVLTYDFARNGQRTDFSTAGATWLAQFFLGLDRTTAFAIEKRLPVLLQSGGADNVLSEVERMYSDHAKLVYIRRLIETAPLDAAAIRRAADVAASMSSDHEAAEVIVGVATRYSLADPVSRSVFFKMTLAMRPDYDRMRALLAIFAAAKLSSEEIAAVLTSSWLDDQRALGVPGDIAADNEKGRVLVALAQTQRLDGGLRDAYAASAETIRDARLRSRALSFLSSR
jgi:beta-lactamase regulating signal transducer with metallopeptidase domain